MSQHVGLPHEAEQGERVQIKIDAPRLKTVTF